MSEFNFNFSRFNILLNDQLAKTIKAHARLILIPFFQKIAIRNVQNESGKSYPVLTILAERIITEVYHKGELGYCSAEKAKKIALSFVRKLRDWEKECLAFYFCADDALVEELETDGRYSFLQDVSEDDWDKETGKVITQSIDDIVTNEGRLADCIITELVNLQDIFSTEDANSWDASSISYANENFNRYTGFDIKLIPLSLDEFDYWNDIVEPLLDEDEEEDGDEEDLEDADSNPFA